MKKITMDIIADVIAMFCCLATVTLAILKLCGVIALTWDFIVVSTLSLMVITMLILIGVAFTKQTIKRLRDRK